MGSVCGLVALGLLAAGTGAVVIDRTQREDGFVTSPSHAYATPTYALVSETADLDGPDWAWQDLVGTVRIKSVSDHPVFLGIGRDDDVQGYIGGVAHEIVGDLRDDPGEYERRPGGAPSEAPGAQAFWTASSTGTGEVTLDWNLADGRWAVVLMNADGSRSVDSTLSIGAELDALPWVGGGLLAAGLLLALLAAGLIYAALPKRAR